MKSDTFLGSLRNVSLAQLALSIWLFRGLPLVAFVSFARGG